MTATKNHGLRIADRPALSIYWFASGHKEATGGRHLCLLSLKVINTSYSLAKQLRHKTGQPFKWFYGLLHVWHALRIDLDVANPDRSILVSSINASIAKMFNTLR